MAVEKYFATFLFDTVCIGKSKVITLKLNLDILNLMQDMQLYHCAHIA